jgi:hypothetical protein
MPVKAAHQQVTNFRRMDLAIAIDLGHCAGLKDHCALSGENIEVDQPVCLYRRFETFFRGQRPRRSTSSGEWSFCQSLRRFAESLDSSITDRRMATSIRLLNRGLWQL